MQEQTLAPLSRATQTGGGLGSMYPDTSIFGGVPVSQGTLTESVPGNQTIAAIRRQLRDTLGLDDDTPAQVDNREVDDSTVVRPGQSVRFMHRAGEKGVAAK